MPSFKEKYQNFKNRFKRTLKNLPNYVKAKVKGKPFHWTMTNRNVKKKQNAFKNQLMIKQGLSNKKEALDKLCERLEDKKTLSVDDEFYFKEYCLSKENTNVGKVKIENIIHNTENLNLPLVEEDPLAEAKESIEAATVLLNQLNDIISESYQLRSVVDQYEFLKEREDVLEKLITDIRDYTDTILQTTRRSNTNNSRLLRTSAEELKDAVEAIYHEIDTALELDLTKARLMIRRAMENVKQDKYKNIKNALEVMKQQRKPAVQNIALLGNYSQALQDFYRRQRASRVRRASRGGRQTRRTRH